MRTAATRFGAVLAIAAVGVMSSHAISTAEPAAHQVQYTVTTGQEMAVNLDYLATEPASQSNT